MGNVMLILGLILIAAAVVFYVFRNPRTLEKLAENIRKFKHETNEDLRPGSDESTIVRFRDLRVGEWVEYDPDPNAIKQEEHVVTSRGTYQALNRIERNFFPRGEIYPLYSFDDGKLMLVERPDGWFMFEEAIVLPGESAREFDMAGEAFSHKGQSPRCHSFDWRGMQLSILDVGYLRYQHQGGIFHLPDQTMVKYMLAERLDGRIFYLENLKVGTDRVWLGHWHKDIGQHIGRVLRATA